VALVPDLLSRVGGTSSFSSRDAAIAAGRKLDDETITRDLTSAVNYLKGQNFVRANRVGVTGFCWGGGKALMFTTRSKDIAASVIYYGENPRRCKISAPVQSLRRADERTASGFRNSAAKKIRQVFQYKVYAGAPHSTAMTTPQLPGRGSEGSLGQNVRVLHLELNESAIKLTIEDEDRG
jgi:carboxymethylenebutenolidase